MLNWLSTQFNRRKGLRPAPHLEAVAVHNSYPWPNLAEAEAQSRIYQQSPWVYISVNRIAEAAALVPLSVYRLSGEKRLEIVRHPLEILLDAPNPHLSRFELFEQTVGHLELTGNAYWFLGGNQAGVPIEIWPLRPDRVSIVPDPETFVKGYIYEIDGRRIPLLPNEVVHFKRWHPTNDYYGLSALEAARLAISSDRSMAEWNRNTFGKDNGVPAGVINIKDFVTDADYERLKREWNSSYGGVQRRTAFLRGGSVQWQNIGLSHRDLDFLQGRSAHRDEILNSFGVPVGMLSENATEANAKVAERLFIERTLWPKLVRIAQKITQDLLPFWPGEHIAEFEDIRPTDAQARLDEIRTASTVLSINEIRERYYHLPAVAWGILPAGQSPATSDQSPDASSQTQDSQSLSNQSPAKSHLTLLETGNRKLVTDDQHSELLAWERFALKRWGQPNRRPFAVRALPEEVAFEISAGLLAAANADEARGVFAAARQTLLHETAEIPVIPAATMTD